MSPMRTTFISELGFTMGEDLSVARATVVPELCVPETDVVLTSVLLTWADVLAGPLATEATMPRVCMTNDLTVRLLSRPPTGAVDLRAEVLKSGRTTTFTETWLAPAGAPTAPFAVAHGTFVASPRPQDTIDLTMLVGDRGSRPLLAPLPERLGVRVIEPGVAEVDRRDELLNPADTLQGGVVALVAEMAALSVAGGGAVVHELDVRYLRATRVGPARATARVLRDHGATTTTEVRVVDAGADGRLAAVVVARCGPLTE
jgi:acyl-coenzyme A thioesterase PaaI-like protein